MIACRALLVDASGAMTSRILPSPNGDPPEVVRVVAKRILLSPHDQLPEPVDLPYRGHVSGLALYSTLHVMVWTVRFDPSATRAQAEAELERVAQRDTYGPLIRLCVSGPTVNLDAVDPVHQYDGMYLGQLKAAEA